MDNTLKFYLLAEIGGWDTSAYAFKYRSSYSKSKAYQVLSYNVLEAKNHLSKDAQGVVKEFENLKIEPRTLSEAFVLETKLNYLALHSFPEYYLNPLAVDPNYNGEITSIGELMINIQTKDISINELIEDATIPLEEKKEAVNEKVGKYLEDMDDLVHHSLKTIEYRAFTKKKDKNNVSLARDILESVLFFLANFFFLFTLVFPLNVYWECFYNPSPTMAMTYVIYLFPFALFVYDVFFILFHSYRAKISEPYNYARRFLQKNSEKVFDDIQRQAESLSDYICGAINNRLLLQNDIKDFSKLSTSYVDFKKVLNVSSLMEGKTYKMLKSLKNIFSTISWVITMITFIIYIIGATFRVGF
ncbi:MAG: hypothetical protein K5762_07445 [Bacilli bacterium]|nr:hypothetical protein [Bacilli bacterium]